MMRKHASVLAFLAAVFATPGVAWAQVVKSVGGSEGVAGMFLSTLTERVEQIFASLPALGDYLARLPQQFGLGVTALLLGIVVAGLAAEWLARIAVAAGTERHLRAPCRRIADARLLQCRTARRPRAAGAVDRGTRRGGPGR